MTRTVPWLSLVESKPGKSKLLVAHTSSWEMSFYLTHHSFSELFPLLQRRDYFWLMVEVPVRDHVMVPHTALYTHPVHFYSSRKKATALFLNFTKPWVMAFTFRTDVLVFWTLFLGKCRDFRLLWSKMSWLLSSATWPHNVGAPLSSLFNFIDILLFKIYENVLRGNEFLITNSFPVSPWAH